MAESELLEQIESNLRRLSPETLQIVNDFIAFLTERQLREQTTAEMIASEAVLGSDWNRPEEDAAWATL